MSNAIRYDALLVRDFAHELNRTLAGARLDAASLDRESRRVTLRTRAARRDRPDPPSLLWQLHPESGHITAPQQDAGSGGNVQLGTPTTITRVHAPPDERLIVLDLEAPGAPASAARRIIIELVTNQWNAVAVGADDRITAVLRESARGNRVLRAGAAYEQPMRSARAGATSPVDDAAWHEALGAVPAGERLNALLRFAAYTSPLNAAAIIGNADVTADREALDLALARYRSLVWTAVRTPVLLRLDGRWQPYSRPEPAPVAAEPADTLLAAFGAAAERAAAAPAASDSVDRALAALAERLEAVHRRMRRLRDEQAGASADAAQLRRLADLLLAQLHRVERGAGHVALDDFEGGTVALELDPTMNAADNAARLYDTARKRDRAAHRIPGLLRSSAAERTRIERLAERVRTGEAPPEDVVKLRRTAPGAGPALPYREYRTSGGLEVRVGRGSRANDELTFRHSRPNDVWLHARDAAGAHVILRWDRKDENPPASAIAEAAMLAALFSRARTSGTVAVDWTRRKHVRKPRKAAPGLVIPERVKTVFVEPDAAAEAKMRAEA